MAGDTAFVTIKGVTHGISCVEYEYPIPVADARHILHELCTKPLISKTRSEVEHADQTYDRPICLGQEVSGDPQYFNQNMT